MHTPREPGWRGWRDRLLMNPRFQRWTARLPFTRPIARWQSRALFDVVAGFVYSQVLAACVKLKLLEMLVAGPRTVADLAQRCNLPAEGALRLLAAAASLGLVERRGGTAAEPLYGLGMKGAALLGNPGAIAMIEHHHILYDDLRDPIALLRGEVDTGLARYWAYARAEAPAQLDAARVADYTALMSASQQLVATDILDAYPLARHRCLLDVGGGDGTFIAAAAARYPQLALQLFDLPPVAQRARERLAERGLASRVQVTGGDFQVDALPRGADVISLVRVVHDHNDDTVRALLAAVRAALPDNGVLLLAEPMSGTRGAEPMGDAYFGFYLLAMRRGRPRTAQELSQMVQAAGFEAPRLMPVRLPLQTQVLAARAAVQRKSGVTKQSVN